ncbi:MAG: hypothetical protein L0K69_12955, partial [Enterobacterales bacterium]|nr:hypothetical protein [Enterobacterales bacterium]
FSPPAAEANQGKDNKHIPVNPSRCKGNLALLFFIMIPSDITFAGDALAAVSNKILQTLFSLIFEIGVCQ